MSAEFNTQGWGRVRMIIAQTGALISLPALPATFFFLFAILMVIVGTFVTPPFQTPDEPAHFLRAIQVSQGGLRGINENGQSGGHVPADVLPVLHIFDDLQFHSERRAAPARIDQVGTVGWTGSPTLTAFPNTVTYGPICYVPQAVAIVAGRAFHLSIIHTFYLARLANGAFFAIVAAISIALCRRGKIFLLLILSLPMVFCLAASLSQDAPLIALAALLAALLTRHEQDYPWSWGEWAMMGIGFGILGMAKPPELALSGIACLIVNRRELPRALLCPAIAAVLTFSWLKIGVAPVKIQFLAEQGVSDSGQMHYLLAHPMILPVLIYRSVMVFGEGYYTQFIGVLGWLDTPLPQWFYHFTRRLLAVVFLASFLLSGCRYDRRIFVEGLARRAGIAALIALSVMGTFLSLYVIWTKVGAPVIDGIQGRYFLPIACFMILLLPIRCRPVLSHGGIITNNIIAISLTVWMMITLVVYSHALSARFW